MSCAIKMMSKIICHVREAFQTDGFFFSAFFCFISSFSHLPFLLRVAFYDLVNRAAEIIGQLNRPWKRHRGLALAGLIPALFLQPHAASFRALRTDRGRAFRDQSLLFDSSLLFHLLYQQNKRNQCHDVRGGGYNFSDNLHCLFLLSFIYGWQRAFSSRLLTQGAFAPVF